MVSVIESPVISNGNAQTMLMVILACQVAEEMKAQGWQPGPAAHITPETARIDEGIALRMRCRQCDRRCVKFLPFHNGYKYRGIALCRCGGRREV